MTVAEFMQGVGGLELWQFALLTLGPAALFVILMMVNDFLSARRWLREQKEHEDALRSRLSDFVARKSQPQHRRR